MEIPKSMRLVTKGGGGGGRGGGGGVGYARLILKN